MKVYLEVDVSNDVQDKNEMLRIAADEIKYGRFELSLKPRGSFVAIYVDEYTNEMHVVGTYNTHTQALKALREKVVDCLEEELSELSEEEEVEDYYNIRDRIREARRWDISEISELFGCIYGIVKV